MHTIDVKPRGSSRKPTPIQAPNNVWQIIAGQARRGALLLDKRVPGWHDRIKTSTLNMHDSCRCIYGQLKERDLLCEIEKARRVARNKRGYGTSKPVDPDEQYGYYPAESTTIQKWLDSLHYKGEIEDMVIYNIPWTILQEEWLREIYLRREADEQLVAQA